MATGERRDWVRTPPPDADSWPGWVALDDATSLWGRELSAWWTFIYNDDQLPVRMVADSHGLYLSPRGPLVRRILHGETAFVPWTDVAGCRERSIGFHSAGGTLLSLVRLHRVTIDLVGASAEGHLPEPTPEEHRKMLKKLGIDPDEADGPEEELTPTEIAEDEALDRELYGPDWRPGTFPLVFTTRRPQLLVDAINGRRRGRPDLRPR